MARRVRAPDATPAIPPDELARFDEERWAAPADDEGELAEAFGGAFMRGVMARGRWSTARLTWARENDMRRFPRQTAHQRATP